MAMSETKQERLERLVRSYVDAVLQGTKLPKDIEELVFEAAVELFYDETIWDEIHAKIVG
jgi:hypothetical protein